LNQILDHSGPKNNKAPTNSNDIKKIIKVFSIIILIFGIVLIGFGIFTVVKNNKSQNPGSQGGENIEPTVSAEKVNDTSVTIKVSHSKTIETVEYCWDTNSFQVLKGTNDQKEMTVSDIGIPTGNHTLHVKVTDIDDQEYNKEFQFSAESGVDTTDPFIDIVIQGTTVEIVATDETELAFMTYSINGGQEETLKPEGDKTKISKILEVQEGVTTSIVARAVDTSNNESIKEKPIVIYSKPVITATKNSEGTELTVSVTCSIEITSITLSVNGKQQDIPLDTTRTSTTDGSFKHQFKFKITPGTRTEVVVTADTGVEGVKETFNGYINN